MRKLLFPIALTVASCAFAQQPPFIPLLKKDGGYSFVDPSNGKPLPALDARLFLWPQSNGLLIVQKDLLFGGIDRTGTMVVPNKFDVLNDFIEDRALAMSDGKYLFIDGKGKAVSARYDYARDFHNGFALVARKEKYGFINRLGKEVVPLVYDLPHPDEGQDQIEEESLGWGFSEGLGTAWKGKKVGFVNGTGKLVIPARYEWAEPFREGLALVMEKGKMGFINKSGAAVLPFRFDGAGKCSEGLVWTYRDDQPDSIVYYNSRGQRVFGGAWRRGGEFSEGLAAIEVDTTWGYINKEGRLVILTRFENAEPFRDGYAEVQLTGGKCGLIDTKGNWVLQPIYSNLYRLAKGWYGVEKDELQYCVSVDGKEWKE